MKKIIAISLSALILVSMLASFAVSAAGSIGTVTPTTASDSVVVGETFTVEVKADSPTKIEALTFKLLFDPALVELVPIKGQFGDKACVAGESLGFFTESGGSVMAEYTYNAGAIVDGGVQLIAGGSEPWSSTGETLLLTATFKAKAVGNAEFTIAGIDGTIAVGEGSSDLTVDTAKKTVAVVDPVAEVITAIGGLTAVDQITADNYTEVKAAYDAAKAAYDALSDKTGVTNSAVLTAVGEKLDAVNAQIVAAAKLAEAIAAIDGLTPADEITADNYAEVQAAYDAAKAKYDALTDKTGVTNSADLTAIGTKLAAVKAEMDVAKVVAAIDALTPADQITVDNYTAVKAAYDAAKADYDALADKTGVTNAAKLDTVSAKLEAVKAEMDKEPVIVPDPEKDKDPITADSINFVMMLVLALAMTGVITTVAVKRSKASK